MTEEEYLQLIEGKLEAAIEKLESGIMQYPEKAQAFKDAVAYGLYKKYSYNFIIYRNTFYTFIL